MPKAGPLLVAPFPGLYLRRSVTYWVLLHLTLVVLKLLLAYYSGEPVNPAELLPGGNPLVVVLVVALGMLEARRRDEDLFLANLGYGWPTIAGYMAVPAAVLEAAFTVGRFGWGTAAAYLALPGAGVETVLAGWWR
ncbi:MAG TPA: hypothetical protein VGR37_02335 [Longimicrobiaceae bacterium]|nr:hypothetical protein [Longimicrobiaceae bacterium]